MELDDKEGTPVKKPKLLRNIDVGEWIVRDACQCLNESRDKSFLNLFQPFVCESKPNDGDEAAGAAKEEGFLASNVDDQLLLLVHFAPRLKLSELHLQVFGDGSAPDRIRLFVNEPNLSFEDVEDATPAQSTSLSEQDPATEGDNVFKIQLKATKFHKVGSVSLYVENNIGGQEKTRVRRIRFIGDAYEKVLIDLTK